MTRAEPRPPGWIAGSAGASLGLIGALWGTGAIEPPAIWPRHDPHYRNGTKPVTDHAGAAVDFRT